MRLGGWNAWAGGAIKGKWVKIGEMLIFTFIKLNEYFENIEHIYFIHFFSILKINNYFILKLSIFCSFQNMFLFYSFISKLSIIIVFIYL